MRIITWNILSGTPTREGADLVSAINQLDADVLAIQEVDHLQPRSNQIKTVELIAEKCNYRYWAFAPALTGTPGFKWEDSHDFINNNDNKTLPTSYGIGMLSRVPVVKWQRYSLKKSLIGLPLAITSPKGTRIMYVPDEPRAVIAAELENEITVISAHLSFVPPVNTLQLRKIKNWANDLPGKKIYIGDLNALLFGTAGIKSINSARSYPAWGPKVKFDYILSNELHGVSLDLPYTGMSDHLPIGVEI